MCETALVQFQNRARKTKMAALVKFQNRARKTNNDGARKMFETALVQIWVYVSSLYVYSASKMAAVLYVCV